GRSLHRVADYVTTNSHTNRLLIELDVPSLVGRIVTIYNAVDMDRFHPGLTSRGGARRGVHLVGVASYLPNKNIRRFIEAIAVVRRERSDIEITADWYGGWPKMRSGQPLMHHYEQAKALIRERGLVGRVTLRPPTRQIAEIYRKADAVVLPSYYEG